MIWAIIINLAVILYLMYTTYKLSERGSTWEKVSLIGLMLSMVVLIGLIEIAHLSSLPFLGAVFSIFVQISVLIGYAIRQSAKSY